ncbi:hypothetical protein ET008_07685, partial [Lactococcus garvieae]|nr:hypothetical protein [Lactococcus garvieae]
VFNGSYYYGIHVDSQLISPDHSDEFLAEGDGRLADFLTGVQNNSMDDGGSTNPRAEVDSPPSAFDFSAMNPGRVFTMAGEQYRYLEDMGNGDHLIIRNHAFRNISWNDQEDELTAWYGRLNPVVQSIVQPVANSFTTGEVSAESVTFTGGTMWLPNNLEGEVAEDITRVVSGGSRRAFALSLADVTRLSGEGLAFPNHAQRGSVGASLGWWWQRTPATSTTAWRVGTNGTLYGFSARTLNSGFGGVRPALIINPSN